MLSIGTLGCQFVLVSMYASLDRGGQHHKSDAGNQAHNFLVNWFYNYYWLFGYLCVGTKFTYILLFLYPHVPQNVQLYIQMRLLVCVPSCPFH